MGLAASLLLQMRPLENFVSEMAQEDESISASVTYIPNRRSQCTRP